MTKSKSELNKRLRQQRKDAGLVELRVWVTPNQKLEMEMIANEMECEVKMCPCCLKDRGHYRFCSKYIDN